MLIEEPVATKLKIRVPVERPVVVVDAEDGTKIAELSPNKDVFDIVIRENRGRLLLVKSEITNSETDKHRLSRY